MEILPGEPNDEAVPAAIRRWVGLLAADDFEAAVDHLSWVGIGFEPARMARPV